MASAPALLIEQTPPTAQPQRADTRVYFFAFTCIRGCGHAWVERFTTDTKQQPHGPTYHVLDGLVCPQCHRDIWSLTGHGWE